MMALLEAFARERGRQRTRARARARARDELAGLLAALDEGDRLLVRATGS